MDEIRKIKNPTDKNNEVPVPAFMKCYFSKLTLFTYLCGSN